MRAMLRVLCGEVLRRGVIRQSRSEEAGRSRCVADATHLPALVSLSTSNCDFSDCRSSSPRQVRSENFFEAAGVVRSFVPA